jgi:hypothetical protein
MYFRLNQILYQGKFKTKKNKHQILKKLHFKLGRNALVVTQNSVSLFLNRDIRFIVRNLKFIKKHIKNLLKFIFRTKIKHFVFKISNLHMKLKLSAKAETVLTKVVPQLNLQFPIHYIEVTQEDGAGHRVSLESLKTPHFSYISFILKITDLTKFITLKFLKSKSNPNQTNLTLIACSFSEQLQNILSFFEREQWRL